MCPSTSLMFFSFSCVLLLDKNGRKFLIQKLESLPCTEWINIKKILQLWSKIYAQRPTMLSFSPWSNLESSVFSIWKCMKSAHSEKEQKRMLWAPQIIFFHRSEQQISQVFIPSIFIFLFCKITWRDPSSMYQRVACAVIY